MILRVFLIAFTVAGSVGVSVAQECNGAPSYTTAELENRDAPECRRSQAPVCERIRPALEQAVFIGTVLRVRYSDGHMILNGECTKTSLQTVTVKVGEVFKGNERDVVTIQAGNINGFYFQDKKTFLIFAKPQLDGTFAVTSCGGSKEIHQASMDIAYLRSWASRPAGGEVFGRAWKLMSKQDEARMIPRSMPMQGQQISLDGPTHLSLKTDAAGQYKTSGLPPGQYEISLDSSYATWPSRIQKFDLVERGCARVDFSVDPFRTATENAAK